MRKLTISEIKTMGNKAVVESFAAKIITVYKATDPSPAQAEKGIHKQGLVVGLGDETLSVTLNEATLHMDKSFEGKMMGFTCTTSDDGRAVGMVINRWKKGEEDRIGVDVWAKAEFFEMTAEGGQKLPAPQEIPAGDIPKDPKNGIYNYFGFYRYIYDIVEDKMEGTGVTPDALKEAVTHYMIGLQQRGSLQDSISGWFVSNLKSEPFKVLDIDATPDDGGEITDNGDGTVNVAAGEAYIGEGEPPTSIKPSEPEPENTDSTPDPSDEPIPWDEVTDSEGKVISEMNRDELTALCIKLIPFSESDHPVIKPGYTAMENSRQMMELSYADIYDVYEVSLNQSHDLQAISDAYHKIEGTPKLEAEVVCQRILSDQTIFVEMVQNHEPAKA